MNSFLKPPTLFYIVGRRSGMRQETESRFLAEANLAGKWMLIDAGKGEHRSGSASESNTVREFSGASSAALIVYGERWRLEN